MVLSSIFKQALTVNKKPFPWVKAACAGVAAALPVLIGFLFGNIQYGLLAGLGSFSYLYVFNIPYAQRAKKIFFVVIGMTLCAFLGTLTAPYPLATAIMMGVIGAVAIFIFGALKIAGPSAIFFVLVFSMTNGMPVETELVLVRAGLVFLGGAVSWCLAMAGWFFHPHQPEIGVVKREYLQLAEFLESIGTNKFREVKHQVMAALKDAEDTLAAGYIPWHKNDVFNRLYLLNSHAHTIFLFIIENYSEKSSKVPVEIINEINGITEGLLCKKKGTVEYNNQINTNEYNELYEKVLEAVMVMNESSKKIKEEITFMKPSVKTVCMGAFDKSCIVFITALRFGLITTFAAIVAYQFEFARSYWVPLSCVAVMSGSTIIATYHRAIQRGFGTIFGILIASILLITHPTGYVLIVYIMLLTFITELFIVKNYGLAALFFTPNALLMAECVSGGSFSFSYFASARLIDVLIGSFIGLIGVLVIGRRSASSRLPHLIGKTIRSQAQLLLVLFSNQEVVFNEGKNSSLIKMQTNINNLRILYNTAIGEIPVNKDAIEYYWSIIFSIEQLGFLLEKSYSETERIILSDEILSKYLYALEMMANASVRENAAPSKEVPDIEGFESIKTAVLTLQHSLQIN